MCVCVCVCVCLCVCVGCSGSTDDGFCELSTAGAWLHTSQAQLPYGPFADHTNGTGMHFVSINRLQMKDYMRYVDS